ncbi:hypothetical protein DL770_010251 [Monosporascus sp. CRB-9-2]|nr:hypothetical protein DL770_010251 [Monosporascus sp. CRB-9-2]
MLQATTDHADSREDEDASSAAPPVPGGLEIFHRGHGAALTSGVGTYTFSGHSCTYFIPNNLTSLIRTQDGIFSVTAAGFARSFAQLGWLRTDPDLRKPVYANIVLSGGSSLKVQ